MPSFYITAPDGSRHKVNAPDGADDKSILGFISSILGSDTSALPEGLTTQQANNMSQQDLNALRIKYAQDQQAQRALSPFEHKATAREAVEENPLMAIPYAAMVPGYAAAKALNLLPTEESTTPPSMAQIVGGYEGIGQGLANAFENRIAQPIAQLIRGTQNSATLPAGVPGSSVR